MPIEQHALTVIAPIGEGRRDALAEAYGLVEKRVVHLLAQVKTLHFGRWVFISNPDRLVFESNYDGDLGDHLHELLSVISAANLEETLFGGWVGYETGKLSSFCAAHARPANAFYLGHPGLSVEQILDDEALRGYLAEAVESVDRKKTAVAIRKEVIAAAKQKGWAPKIVDRGLPDAKAGERRFWLTAIGVGVVALLLSPIAIVVELDERFNEKKVVPDWDEQTKRDEITVKEDVRALNGLTHHVPLRDSAFRKSMTKLVLWFVEVARKNLCFKGDLTGIASIHFARWVMLEDDAVLFLSNYDGSWESYLGDFVDKAHYWLTAAWMGAVNFPSTYLYVFGGASKETEFKQWTRRWQVPNQIWYSAYPYLSMANVLNNDRLRQGAIGEMTEQKAREWLSRI